MKKSLWKLVIILLFTAVVRFGGLNWCLPYNPHPDEWNMAHAVTQLTFKGKLNPHFFAYGQFPLYLTFFSAKLYNLIPWIHLPEINTSEAVFFLRFWSAVAGVGIVYLVYLISKRLFTTNYSLLAAILAAFIPGLIQISHFGTTESLLSFFFLLILFLSFKILEKPKLKYFIFSGIVFGLAVGTKISALIFGIPIFLIFLIQTIAILKRKNIIKDPGIFLSRYLIFLIVFVFFIFLSSPYLILAFKDSQGTLFYETSVAAGKSAVFYTRQFVNTIPVFFQLQKIFPYTLGWPIFVLGSLGLIFSFLLIIKNILNKNKFSSFNTFFLLFNVSFLFYFLSQAFLFTKWTRFMAPLFAFFPIFACYFLYKVSFVLKSKKILNTCFLILVSISIIPGILFFSIYFLPDIRFTASDWIYKNIPAESFILFDTGNVVDMPVHNPKLSKPSNFSNYSLISFDFYHLDERAELFQKLLNYLKESDYIIVPSRRIFTNHLRLSPKYPLTAKYYNLLFSGKLGFTPVAKIEPFYSKIFNDEMAEETFTVFDHPTIRIYKKIKQLTKEDYNSLFQNETI